MVPPFTALGDVGEVTRGTALKVGAQNMHWAESGAYTGEISPLMIKECGAELVELGHFERRREFGETDCIVNLKVRSALEHGLRPLVCVGETAVDRDCGVAEEVVVLTGQDGASRREQRVCTQGPDGVRARVGDRQWRRDRKPKLCERRSEKSSPDDCLPVRARGRGTGAASIWGKRDRSERRRVCLPARARRGFSSAAAPMRSTTLCVSSGLLRGTAGLQRRRAWRQADEALVIKGRIAFALGARRPLEIEEFPVTPPGPQQIVVRVLAAGVCGSDVHIWRGEVPFPMKLPSPLGHEMIGEVYAVGAERQCDSLGRKLDVGDRVTYVTSGDAACALPAPPGRRRARTATRTGLA